MKLAYVDSCVWIARVEGLSVYKNAIDEHLVTLAQDGWIFCTSEVVSLEVLIKPLQAEQDKLVRIYRQIFDEMRLLASYSSVFSHALLIAQLENLKSMDSIHVAMADYHNCGLFVSSDPHFRHLKVITPF